MLKTLQNGNKKKKEKKRMFVEKKSNIGHKNNKRTGIFSRCARFKKR